jgi:hypothetical protein
MKKLLTILLCGLAYQSFFLQADSITATSFVDGTIANLQLSTSSLNNITESQLTATVTNGAKYWLYQTSDIPTGWGAARLVQDILLSLGGFPAANSCYIQGEYVYDSTGTKIGKYKAALVSYNTAVANGWSCVNEANNSIGFLRIVVNSEQNEIEESIQAMTIATAWEGSDADEVNLAQQAKELPYVTYYNYSNGTITESLYTYQHSLLEGTYFLQVYIDRSDV